MYIIRKHVYEHIKTGGLYRVKQTARMENDGTDVVVYESLETGEAWVRPVKEFSEKFRELNLGKTIHPRHVLWLDSLAKQSRPQSFIVPETKHTDVYRVLTTQTIEEELKKRGVDLNGVSHRFDGVQWWVELK